MIEKETEDKWNEWRPQSLLWVVVNMIGRHITRGDEAVSLECWCWWPNSKWRPRSPRRAVVLMTNRDVSRDGFLVRRPRGVTLWFGQVKTTATRRVVVLITDRDAVREGFPVNRAWRHIFGWPNTDHGRLHGPWSSWCPLWTARQVNPNSSRTLFSETIWIN